MKKWRQFPSIVAKRRNAETPDRHFTNFQQLLQLFHPKKIRAYYWAKTFEGRNMPRVDIIMLWQRRATMAATACITAALEAAFDDGVRLSVVVTTDSKAFRSMVTERI
jgi:hypothetical protein